MSQVVNGSGPPPEEDESPAAGSTEDVADTQRSALHDDAAVLGDRGRVQVLDKPPSVQADDNLDAVTDGSSLTALHMACSAGHQEAVLMLLDEERLAAINTIARVPHPLLGRGVSWTALDWAIGNGRESVACLLLRHLKFDAADASALPPGLEQELDAAFSTLTLPCDALQGMAHHNMVQGVEAYLAWHARRKPCEALRPGALFPAANAGHGAMVEVLGSHPRVTALHAASYHGHLRAVQAILGLSTLDGGAYGAAINAKSSGGKHQGTALHYSVLMHHEQVARHLLRSAAFTADNAVDGFGQSALHLACQEQLEQISIEIIRNPRFSRHRLQCCLGRTVKMVAKDKELSRVLDALAKFR